VVKSNQTSTISPIFEPDVSRQIQELGLDVSVIQVHQHQILRHLSAGSPRVFPIIDTCRLDNGGILRLPDADTSFSGAHIPLVALVPAAGASSRYLAPLVPLMNALKTADAGLCIEALRKLAAEGYLNCPLPQSVLELVTFFETSRDMPPPDLATRVLLEIDAPKALYPAVLDGVTFLDVKRMEHKAIGDFVAEVYVCPPGRKEEFLELAKARDTQFPVQCYEQDSSLATTRFDTDGRVARDGAGQVSMVPAGHGSLLRLLPRVARDFQGSRGVFIRNIDNVAGIAQGATEAARKFLLAFKWSLSQMDIIRTCLDNNDSKNLQIAAQRLLKFWGIDVVPEESAISTLITKLFHTSLDEEDVSLRSLCRRPFVLMGQVPNTSQDVGGTCVFTEIDGVQQKLCLEVPHASETDRKIFLENPHKATHFNPVFVAAEIPDENILRGWQDHPFWLVAKKSWQGRDTYYQESILYEMLGSSHYTNVIFTEVPRLVFNPHKTLKDAGSKTLRDWT
jgi:hypothetical protein